jgi:membrane protein YdbS with pleckstrin-like domain
VGTAALIVAALFLAVIAVIWILLCAFSSPDGAVNPSTEAYRGRYVGGGLCLLGAVTVLFLAPAWLRQKPWVGAAITCCFGISFFGMFLAFLSDISLGSS